MLVVVDDALAVEFREVGLVEGVVDALAELPRRRVFTGFVGGDGLREFAQRDGPERLLEVFEDAPTPVVPEDVVDVRLGERRRPRERHVRSRVTCRLIYRLAYWSTVVFIEILTACGRA
ncbi:hypothetical protein [Halobacterium sp. CBA1126]|uniref:hypothetical protein n=1 Tax=Halobacterium sp. CBA1126 TaxID=2668074 RepID=UPI0018D25774|nr:hypothetical protein [Halobacterium sp. CBA1126]